MKEFKRDVNTRLVPEKSDTIAKNKVKMPKRISNDCTNHFELNIKVHAVHMHHFVGGNHFGQLIQSVTRGIPAIASFTQ